MQQRQLLVVDHRWRLAPGQRVAERGDHRVVVRHPVLAEQVGHERRRRPGPRTRPPSVEDLGGAALGHPEHRVAERVDRVAVHDGDRPVRRRSEATSCSASHGLTRSISAGSWARLTPARWITASTRRASASSSSGRANSSGPTPDQVPAPTCSGGTPHVPRHEPVRPGHRDPRPAVGHRRTSASTCCISGSPAGSRGDLLDRQPAWCCGWCSRRPARPRRLPSSTYRP